MESNNYKKDPYPKKVVCSGHMHTFFLAQYSKITIYIAFMLYDQEIKV